MNTTVATLQLPDERTLSIVHGDITTELVDVIVNAANSQLAHGGGVAAAISRKGGPDIQLESHDWVRDHGPVATGHAVMTTAGHLPCKAVIHAVGPVWHGGGEGEESKLRSAVRHALDLADASGFSSIALPAISAGIFGFPVERCAEVMHQEAVRFSEENRESPVRDIRIVLFDQTTLDLFKREFDRHQ